MAGLCEGGNEPSGSLKAICKYNVHEAQAASALGQSCVLRKWSHRMTGRRTRKLCRFEANDIQIINQRPDLQNSSSLERLPSYPFYHTHFFYQCGHSVLVALGYIKIHPSGGSLVNCLQTVLYLTSDTNMAPIMRQLGQEIMG
ncbi:hypothetical protein ANN_23996 [Periplaneta americana]|uniref:Uncharacterized protein n=1 Tax=Periplaneta americana TaxID=6978 RepID=A0ABQ8S219_PERAM|nr:hypothetical protein ANN_23996 [Periplaneta americana]